MSGPPYPRYAPGASPGGNAIGSLVIGSSPVGDVPAFDVWTTVLSQYANSPIITQLVTDMAQYVDPTRDMDAFFDNVFNIDTAVGAGLDRIGRIVGVGRVVQLPSSSDFLGFNEAGSWQPFGQAPFYSAGGAITDNVALSDDAYRLLLFAKALANICDGSIPSINQLLLNLFPGLGNCYIVDGLNLTMTYAFEFLLTPVQLAIVANSGVLPRTTGVSVIISQGLPR